MPYRNVPDELQDKMESCVMDVQAKGHDKESAIAICYTSVVEGKSIEQAIKDFDLSLEALKVGARHSQTDREALQSIHDGAVVLGAICAPKETAEIPIRSLADDELVYFGDAVKALGNGKIGGRLVRFSTDDDPDITGEFFTKDTDFGDSTSADVYYNHGLDPVLKKRKLSKATLRQDEFGVWAETQLSMRDDYEKFLYSLAEQGKLGWSSGTAPHLVEREQVGKAVWLKSWPLGLDASLTPTPAEPRNGVLPLKSINVQPLMESKPTDALASDEAERDGKQAPEAKANITSLETLEDFTMDITEEKLNELINGAVTAGVEKALKALPAIQSDVQVTKDEADQPFASAGEYFQAVKSATIYGKFDQRLLPLKATGASEGVPSDGGYLLAPQYASGIVDRIYNTGVLLRLVANDEVGPNSNSMVYNAVDEYERTAGIRYGGVRGYWVAEAGSITASSPKFRQMELKLKKVAALCYATDELLADATALESWLTRTVPNELRFQAEAAIFNGDGVGKPQGFMQANALVSPLRVDASEIDATDLATMWSRRWAGLNDYVWLASPSIFPQLAVATIGNVPVLLPNNQPFVGNPSFTLFGRPYYETEYNAPLGDVGDLVLVSPSQYQTITKGGIQSASSIHVAFTTQETAFRFTFRIDGQCTWNAALASYSATATTYSPFVALASASS